MAEYSDIVKHYEGCFAKHGDTPQGVDWPNAHDAEKRYAVMADLFANASQGDQVLDLGCGAGHFLEFLQANKLDQKVHYSGLDLSESFIAHCKAKFPSHSWYVADLLKEDLDPVDWVVMNGVFTERVNLSFEEMLTFWKRLVQRAFTHARKGIAFNVMSSQVDWQRDDLFHLPMDTMAAFVVEHLSRHTVIRRDYGLYEYTVYVYREPNIT
jgi:SAM-dependent methyltransferase